MLSTIEETLQLIMSRADEPDALSAMKGARVCGFPVCPPAGKDVSQDDMQFNLTSILKLNTPTTLYQLPQITKNEINTNTMKNLTNQFHNLILFKDNNNNNHMTLTRKDL